MNSEQQQQRIMGYFIEEAREHLQTIEQGVLNLQDVLDDSESVNELFRAAHSIKGGAAMLGVGSIQHVAHRLEDFFKILKENPQINVDERLKSLLLAGFDPLTELLDELQGCFRISDQLTNETNSRVKPVFAELESYLNQLVSDTNENMSEDLSSQEIETQEPEEIAYEPLELIVSQESVFQEEITTKMRDMLQLFRGEDSAESRSQLQAICSYFQEVGNNFNLRNWTNLATQIKNAIAQPSNSYRALAPILIRELKESQDLVLANREAEISVSSKLQGILPYRFSEPEDDEISTIFTTAFSNTTDESVIEEPENLVENAPENIVDSIDLDPDMGLDLFADQINEEPFDLVETPSEQMDWMDGEYEISEHQHIDGPKVGASELKSLAILFENDDIDFDAAWEDIESNETSMSTNTTDQSSGSQDEFADLLGNTFENDNAPRLIPVVGEESSIEQLFGESFTITDELKDHTASLFPEDLDSSWDQTPEIDYGINANISDEISVEFDDKDENLDQLFSNDLGDENISDQQFNFDLDLDDINALEAFEDISENIDTSEPEQVSLNDRISVQIHDENSFDSLSSEEYFAELERQENAIADNADDILSQTSEPFALTFSEEGMTLLEDPFAIERNLDDDILGSPLNVISEKDEEFVDAEIDIFSGEIESVDYAFTSDIASDDINNDSGLNIFDELGFDTDENDLIVDLQGFDNSSDNNNEPDDIGNANIPVDESYANLSASDASLLEGSFFDEVNNFSDMSTSTIDNSTIDNIDGEIIDSEIDVALDSSFASPQFNTFDLEIDDDIDDDAVDFINTDKIDSLDRLGELFVETEGDQNVSESIINDNFIDTVESDDSLENFFAGAEDAEIVNDIDQIFGDEAIDTDDLDDFLSGSEEAELTVNHTNNEDDLDNFFATSEAPETNFVQDIVEISNSIDELNEPSTSVDLMNFFADAENSELVHDEINGESNIVSNELRDELSDNNNLDDLFNVPEETENLIEEDVIGDEWNYLSTELEMDEEEAGNVVSLEAEEYIDFDSSQDVNAGLFETANEIDSEEVRSLEVFERVNHSDESSLADLFADEDAMSETEDDFNFGDERSLTQEVSMQDQSLDLTDLQTTEMDENLTTIQDVTNLEEDFMNNDMDNDLDVNITAKNTIDNLVDFFQGDDEDSDDSVLHTAYSLDDGSLAVDETLNFDEFDETNEDETNEFVDLNGARSEMLNLPIAQHLRADDFEIDTQLQDEGVTGIDDNFDFDDLEAMIGNSNEDSSTKSNNLSNQLLQPFESGEYYSSGDMNFDELEALLGEPDDFDTLATSKSASTSLLEAETFIVVPSTNPVDDFDELENMLQSAFAKDVGPIKTKGTTRPPTTTRKPRLTDSTMRVDVKYLDSLNNLVGELVVNRNLLEQDQERLQQFITNLLHQVQLLSDVSQRMRDQYDRSLLEASLNIGRTSSFGQQRFDPYSGDNSSPTSSATNDFEGIEFDRYNTFHVLSQEIIELIVRVRESASDIEFVVTETDQVTRQLGTITTQVQDDLKQSRMVPFAQIADRLPRGIRDRALKTGKQADLEIFGRETLIDKAILEQLTDPLTHLVNNAIDHGLEDPATRQAAGKSATGRLTVRTYHQGNQTVISISDDGAGISTEKVKKSAVSKRMRTQSEVDALNDTEVYALLFEPGFSTKSQADEFSGRGVGLDVVKTCLDDIRGVIIVESLVGKGTTFTIRLPLTLSISKAMFCISDRARVAFPVDGFEDMVEVPQSQIVLNEKGQPCLPWRDTILPFQHLSNLLSYSRHLSRSNIYGKQDNDEICIIILRNDTSYLALQVDQFLGEYEIVIKQLEGPIPQPAGIAGATVLGDGRVMAIANVLELFDIASGRLRPSTSGKTIQPIVEEDIAADPTVLIVDDSITVRELLSLTFAKVGYRVEQAKDGQDAWEKLRAGLPCDMIFCDIEMPRMDGLDLLSRLQKDARLKDIPVAMLTSRGADRHRQSAIQLGAKGYFTKPYLEEELLSASKRLLNGETLPI